MSQWSSIARLAVLLAVVAILIGTVLFLLWWHHNAPEGLAWEVLDYAIGIGAFVVIFICGWVLGWVFGVKKRRSEEGRNGRD